MFCLVSAEAGTLAFPQGLVLSIIVWYMVQLSNLGTKYGYRSTITVKETAHGKPVAYNRVLVLPL